MLDRRIYTFLTLCKTMNYRAASEQLHITQPAVTQHIQFLEQYYRCRLFIYDGRRLKKTSQAEIIERSLNAMSYQEERLLASLTPSTGYNFSIGATKTIGEFVIAEQVANFLADKNNHLSISVDNTARILEMLDSGELDFAIIEGFFDCNTYAGKLYRSEKFVGLCSVKHRFAGKIVAIEDLQEEDLLIREAGSGTRDILEQLLKEHNRSINSFARTICISNLGLIERLLASGNAITFAYIAAAARADSIANFNVDGWDISRDFNYAFLKNCGAEEAVDIFESYRQK